MKRQLLYGPLLGLRKVIVYLLATAVALGFLIYFLANSPWVIQKVADSFAPDYNISYSRIYGNALTGIEIDDLAYNEDSLAKHITLRWNPNGFLKKEIIVNRLQIDQANVDTIKTLVAFFSQADSNESKEGNESNSEPLDIGVDIHHLSLSLEPFVEQGIMISHVKLDVKDTEYSSDNINVGALDLSVDTNVTSMVLDASLNEGNVKIKELTIKELNALALQTLFISDSNESNVTVTVEDEPVKDETVNPLIPKWVYLDKLELNILPFVYDPLDIRELDLSGKNAVFNVEKLLLQKADLDLHSSTNLSDLHYKTKVKNNKLIGKVNFKPKKPLFKLYELPIRREAIGDIVFDLNVSEEEVITDLHITMDQLLKAGKDDFNLDIDNLHTHVVYSIKEGSLKAESNLVLTTPYAKDVQISNLFTMDENIHYSGDIYAEQIIGAEPKFLKPLNHLKVKYKGDTQSIDTQIESDNLQGTFISSDFKKAKLHFETKEAIVLNEMIQLPGELNQSKSNIVIDVPISFEENASIVAHAKIDSNVLNIDANVSYDDRLVLKSVSMIPEESLLRSYSNEVKWDSLHPIAMDAELKGNVVDAVVKANRLNIKTFYDLNTTEVDGKVVLGGLHTDISGVVQEKLTINTKINSMASLVEAIESIYTLPATPMVKGSAALSVELNELKSVDITLNSPMISYSPDTKTDHYIYNIDLAMNIDESKLLLKRYVLTYADQSLFSTKPSTIILDDTNVTINPFWLNDKLQFIGEYDLKTRQGTIEAKAEKLHLEHAIVDMYNDIDIDTIFDGNKTSVNGKITILGGDIHYDLSQKTYASDSDIIIVQDIKEKKESDFMDHLTASILIETKKPLVYKKGDIDIKADADLTIHKAEFSELMVLGSVTLLKGGSYTFEGKKFVLGESHVYFTGNPNKPILDASVTYKPAHHLITITITGTADAPNIDFSSKPSLTKEQILSIILFDSDGGAGVNSGDNMMKMMGGAMAKSVLSDVVGIDVDHLVVGEGSSIEVGKKLSEKLLAILNTVTSQLKLKYLHGRHTESVVSFGAESQSYDIIYRREFE